MSGPYENNPWVGHATAGPPVRTVTDVTGSRRWLKIGTWFTIAQALLILGVVAYVSFGATTALAGTEFTDFGLVVWLFAAIAAAPPVVSIIVTVIANAIRKSAPNFSVAAVWFAAGMISIEATSVAFFFPWMIG